MRLITDASQFLKDKLSKLGFINPPSSKIILSSKLNSEECNSINACLTSSIL